MKIDKKKIEKDLMKFYGMSRKGRERFKKMSSKEKLQWLRKYHPVKKHNVGN